MSDKIFVSQAPQIESEFKEKYKNQLDGLLRDEKQIRFFCDLIDQTLWGNIDERIVVINCTIDFCEKNNLDVAKAWMYYYLAWHYSEMSECQKAIDTLNMARDIFSFNDNVRGILYAESGLVFMYCDKGYFEKAIYMGISSMAKAEDAGERDVLLKIMLSTAIANVFQGDYESAESLITTIHEKFTESEISGTDEIIYYKTLLEIRLNLGRHDEEETAEILRHAKNLMSESDVVYYFPEYLKLEALYFEKKKDYARADRIYQRADHLAAEKGLDILECEILLYWATLKFKMGEDRICLSMLKRVEEVSRLRSFLRLKRAYNYVLYDYCYKAGDYSKALEYLEEFSTVEGMFPDVGLVFDEAMHSDKDRKPTDIKNLLNNKNDILLRIGQKIASTFEPMNIVNDVYNELGKLVQMDFFGVVIYDEKMDEINAAVFEDDTVFEMEPINISFRETFFGACLKKKKTIVTNDIMSDYSKYVSKIDMTGRGIVNPISLVFLPLIMNGETLGAMTVQSLRPDAYTPEDISLLKIVANYMAVSIRNSLKYSQIKHEAIYDGLTGFFLRHKAYEIAEDLISSIGEEHSAVSVTIVDIDDFKRVNDTYGHISGDKLLIQFSDFLRENTARRYSVGRYGGDEFLLIGSDISKDEHVIQLDKLRSTVEKSVFVLDNGERVHITVSVGSCYCTDSGLSAGEAVEVADRALYQVKDGGKNSILVDEIYAHP